MSFKPLFKIGHTYTNAQITEGFQCGNMGGMRRSHKTNTLVIFSDHTKGLYEDKWYGTILHYTGMGKNGDQDIYFQQNKTLAESNTNGVAVHLFEALIAQEYIYKGVVKLCGEPYQEVQKDEAGGPRNVWMFPLALTEENSPLDEQLYNKYKKAKEIKVQKLTAKQILEKAQNTQSSKTSTRVVASNVFERNPYVTELAKIIANGKCALCQQPAPFKDKNGKPYLETHHIQWLSQGGTDTIDNTVALCPNCHRKMHTLNLKQDVEKLKGK